MKIIISILALINGTFMLLDGIYVILNGKYIGPVKPGPWASLFEYFNIDVFRLGPLFIIYGITWLIWLYGFWYGLGWSYYLGLFISIMTLWYLPFGTLISLIILLALIFFKGKYQF